MYLINIQRGQIQRCLKVSIIQKTKRSIEYLGCDIEHFIEIFTKKIDLYNTQNEEKMTWNNIHIDHIKPVNAFNLDNEDEFLDCCHYSNLQPLTVKANLEKSYNWNEDAELFWNNYIKEQEYLPIFIP